MADQEGVEYEICGNCKREIPQSNYVMHSAHCARNFAVCKSCDEPVIKSKLEDHTKECSKRKPKKKSPEPPTLLENSPYFLAAKQIEEQKIAARRERYFQSHERFLSDSTSNTLGSGGTSSKISPKSSTGETIPLTPGNGKSSANKRVKPKRMNAESSTNTVAGTSTEAISNGATSKVELNGTGAIRKTNGSSGTVPKPSSGLMACKYCELELPMLDMGEHEYYCGSRTDRCLICGELVMFKNKQTHLDMDHGSSKPGRESGSKATWDSATQKSKSPPRTRTRRIYTDLSEFDPTDYFPANYTIPKPKIEKGESYKEISRRLDCGDIPPPSRRRNPPTELCIPCEFCETPIPHMDLVMHETGCRPDLFTSRARTRNSTLDDYDIHFPSGFPPVEEPKKSSKGEPTRPPRRKDYSMDVSMIPCEFCHTLMSADELILHQTGCRPDLAQYNASASIPDVELPCEFCEDMIPASQLDRHQATCG